MSAPVARSSRSSGGTVQATRQQLDELDALLQRMLDLPVNQDTGNEEYSPSRLDELPEPPLPPPQPARQTPPSAGATNAPLRSLRNTAANWRPAESVPASRSYPASYMVVETATPPIEPPSSQAETPSLGDPASRAALHLGPRLISPHEEPVPGGRHDLMDEHPGMSGEAVDEETGNVVAEDWVPLRSSWQPSAQTWKPLAETWEQARTGRPEDLGGGSLSTPAAHNPTVHPMRDQTPEELASNSLGHRPGLAGQGPIVVTRPVPIQEPVIPPPPNYWTQPVNSPTDPPSIPVSMPPAPPAMPPQGGTLSLPPSETTPVPPAPEYPSILLPLVWFNQAFDLLLLPLGPLGRWLQGRGGRSLLGVLGLLCLAVAAALLVVADGFGWTH